jgi:ankyrin repeat protein
LEIIEYFSKKNRSTNKNDLETCLIRIFIFYKHKNILEIIKYFIENQKVNINIRNLGGKNLLILLCLHYPHDNIIDIIKYLVKKGINVNCKDKLDWNALHILLRYYLHDNIVDIIKYLVKKGMNINASLNNGINYTNLLINDGIVNLQTKFTVIKFLVGKGIDIYSSCLGFNIFHFLCCKYEGDLSLEIIKYFANIMEENFYYMKPSKNSFKTNYKEVFLLNSKNDCGPTPLKYLIKRTEYDISKPLNYFLSKGANLYSKNAKYKSAYFYLLKYRKHEMSKYSNILQKYGYY